MLAWRRPGTLDRVYICHDKVTELSSRGDYAFEEMAISNFPDFLANNGGQNLQKTPSR